jgi:hypothetical protein
MRIRLWPGVFRTRMRRINGYPTGASLIRPSCPSVVPTKTGAPTRRQERPLSAKGWRLAQKRVLCYTIPSLATARVSGEVRGPSVVLSPAVLAL